MSRLLSILLIAAAVAAGAAAEPPKRRPEAHPAESRRPESRGPESRGAESRGPESHGAESRPAEPRAAEGRQPDSLGADWRQQQSEARAEVRNGRVAPLEKVVSALRKRRPGRLLDAGVETDPDGRTVYRVRWAAADGRRVDYRVDATSGAILSEH